jgi:hypothetical protein
MAWRNVKCIIPGTGRLFRHLGPEEFSGMGECKKELWVAGKCPDINSGIANPW